MIKNKNNRKISDLSIEILKINENVVIKKEETIVEYFLNKELPIKKARTKIKDNDFVIPKLFEYSNLLHINYNIQQLKKICKEHIIRTSGNKDELTKRIYNYMYYSYFSIYIQKIVRKILIKNYIRLHGPGFYNRKRCTNDCDFATLDELKCIPYTQFFSFEDEDKFIYAFDILSIYNLYIKNKTQVHNPFSTKLIDKEVYNNMMLFIKYSKMLNIKININYDSVEKLNDARKLEMKILNLFQQMDSLGNYTDMTWLTSLNKYELIKFMRELADLWHYRANLSQDVKREICPPNGNPFRSLNINLNSIQNYSYTIIKKNVVQLIEEFITKGINNETRTLGCYYILCCLTLVNSSAAEALPWLYESVNY
tara:strand:+ start:52 stop:1155 length:1104 start_codon:yes stop_codon:yes gene_type:complete